MNRENMGPYEGVGAVSVRGRGQSRLSRDPYVVPYEGVGSIEIIEGSVRTCSTVRGRGQYRDYRGIQTQFCKIQQYKMARGQKKLLTAMMSCSPCST